MAHTESQVERRSPETETQTATTCVSCAAPGIVRCRRCDDVLCAAHAPLAGRLCLACEAAYVQARARLRLWPWFFAPFLGCFSYLVLNLRALLAAGGYPGKGFTGHPFSDTLIYSVIAGVLFGSLVAGLRVAVFKWRFRS